MILNKKQNSTISEELLLIKREFKIFKIVTVCTGISVVLALAIFNSWILPKMINAPQIQMEHSRLPSDLQQTMNTIHELDAQLENQKKLLKKP